MSEPTDDVADAQEPTRNFTSRPRAFRVMKADGAFPQLGESASTLGVRIPKDISVDEEGNVTPDGLHGLSVRPSLDDYPAIWIPKRLKAKWRGAAGSNNLRVFRLGDGPFAKGPRMKESIDFLAGGARKGIDRIELA